MTERKRLSAWLAVMGLLSSLLLGACGDGPPVRTVSDMVTRKIDHVYFVTGTGFAYQEPWQYNGANHWRLAPDQPVRTVAATAPAPVRLRFRDGQLQAALEDACHLTEEYQIVDLNNEVFGERTPPIEGIIVKFAWFDPVGPGKPVRWPYEHNYPERCSIAYKADLPPAYAHPLPVPSVSVS